MSTTPFGRKGPAVERLLALCERLRAENGCAWDREQTLATLTPYLLEEVHEVIDAVSRGAPSAVREELGDLLFVTIFALHAAEAEGIGSLEAIVGGVHAKLVHRHPHVFGENPGGDPKRARRQWARMKREESGEGRESVLGAGPRGRPALLEAFRLQEKAASVGFDWPDAEGPIGKIREEIGELGAALSSGDDDAVRAEAGDLLFAAVNACRHLRVDPEQALAGANRRFFDRFRHVEGRLGDGGRRPEDATLDEMEALWREAKEKL